MWHTTCNDSLHCFIALHRFFLCLLLCTERQRPAEASAGLYKLPRDCIFAQ
jgi:hypothetical protein